MFLPFENISSLSIKECLLLLGLAVLIVTFGIQLFFYLKYYTIILRRKRAERNGKITFNETKPPVSVIICSKNEEENLKKFLPSVLEQNYPIFEVILVNDGSNDDSESILAIYRQKYPHLYTTSIPSQAQVISHKKLALTIGIKAAKYDILLFTDADCQPVTKDWISSMVRNFTDKTEFVLGYGGYYSEKGLVSRIVSYDTQFIAMQYLGFADAGKPYMGVGRNMAYRKSTFFNGKGFSGMLHIPSGDDDLFVNARSNKTNTRIECSPESITLSVPKKYFREWTYQKMRHLSTSKFYKSSSKNIIGIEPFTRGLFYISALLLLLFNWQNQIILFSTVGILVARLILQEIIYNMTAQKLNNRKCFILLPFFDIVLPLITLYLLSVGKLFYKRQNYSWH